MCVYPEEESTRRSLALVPSRLHIDLYADYDGMGVHIFVFPMS